MASRPSPSQNFYTAKRKVFWANDYFTTPGRVEQAEPELAQAEELLAGDESFDADDLRSEIAELREKLADMVMPSEMTYVRSAERGVRSVRDYMERQPKLSDSDKEYCEGQLQKVIDESLSRVKHPRKADELKAPVLAEIALIRSQLGIATSARPPPPAHAHGQSLAQSARQPPPPVDMNALSYDDQDRLNRAKRVLGQARGYIESNRTDGVENLFFDATSLMAPVSDAHKDHLVGDIEQLRKDLEATRLAESTRVITGDLDRKLRCVEMDAEKPDELEMSVRSFKCRFEKEDVRQTLTPEMYREYENRLANALAAGAAHANAERLKRAGPELQELRDKLATNPFTGLEQYQASRVDSDLRNLKYKVEREMKNMPEDDAARQSIYKELEVLDAKFEAYSNEWAKAGIYEEYRRAWQMVRNDVQGWEQESFRPDQPLEEPELPQTRYAIRRANTYLHDDIWVQRTRDENSGDAVIAAIDREAEELLEAAGTKMAAAFGQIMDAAEKMETPVQDRWLRDKPEFLLSSARSTFADTKFGEPVLARIQALDQRWKDEVEGAQKSRENLGERLTIEAAQKWPSIVAGIPTISGFDPSSAKPGDTVHLAGVYNRAGWDFDGNQYSFSMRFNGVPLGGIYEPHVDKAFDHALYELKLRVDDHMEWDLVGVVLGQGSIKERTKRTIRRGIDTEEIEEWLPVDCLRLRIIALRAGPIVVGPQS